ncbi:hypothetical protein BH24ACT26_BH24ACT26_11240 [soil metagenome]
MDQGDEVSRLRAQARDDRKLIRRAADALAEIHRGPGLSEEHADVLAALRIHLEGKRRASLEDLLTAAGDIGGTTKKDLGDALTKGEGSSSEWPSIAEQKKDWPGL